MQVSKLTIFEQLPTSVLRERYNEEWERVCDVLIRVYPMSNDSLVFMLRDLLLMNEELETRKQTFTHTT